LLGVDLSGSLDPHQALRRLEGLSGRVLLESAGPRGRFTLLAARPVSVLVADGAGAWITGAGEGPRTGSSFPDPFAGLEALLARYRPPAAEDGPSRRGGHEERTAGPPGQLGRPGGSAAGDAAPFRGAAIGFLAYEAGRHLERLPAPPPDDVGMPEAWFGVYESAVVWDRATGRCRAEAVVLPGRTEAETRSGLDDLVARIGGAGLASSASPTAPSPAPSATAALSPAATAATAPSPAATTDSAIASSLSRAEFVAGVERIRAYVRAGDLFQANLTRRLTASTRLTGVELYERLQRETPAEFAAYLDTGAGEIASASPELFLSLRDGRLVTSPIKGTAPRGRTREEDRSFARILSASAKDRAENVMIVDLLRNDLSRVSRPGSVRVPRLAELEMHPTVHHLVSTVTGTLSEGLGPVDALRAIFPGGSITGAPKIRAMEILAALEPVRRGVYTGAMGLLALDGRMDLSIAIRTAVLKDGRAHYGTGAGITLSSDAEAEWLETEDKARAFRNALAATWGGSLPG
jgi:para-aminobenzoate synthetase component 1